MQLEVSRELQRSCLVIKTSETGVQERIGARRKKKRLNKQENENSLPFIARHLSPCSLETKYNEKKYLTVMG